MCACRLRHLMMRFGLDRVNEIGKLHRVLDEEHRDVVADQVPVALLCIKLRREAAHVPHRVCTAALAGDRREADEHRRALAHGRKRHGPSDVGKRIGAFEVAVCARTTRVDDSLRDSLVVEVRDFFAQDEVLEQRRPARAGPQRILVVRDRDTLAGRQRATAGVDSVSGQRTSVRVCPGFGFRAVLVVLVCLADGARRRVEVIRHAVLTLRYLNGVRECVFRGLGRVNRQSARKFFGRVGLGLQPIGHGSTAHGVACAAGAAAQRRRGALNQAALGREFRLAARP